MISENSQKGPKQLIQIQTRKHDEYANHTPNPKHMPKHTKIKVLR